MVSNIWDSFLYCICSLAFWDCILWVWVFSSALIKDSWVFLESSKFVCKFYILSIKFNFSLFNSFSESWITFIAFSWVSILLFSDFSCSKVNSFDFFKSSISIFNCLFSSFDSNFSFSINWLIDFKLSISSFPFFAVSIYFSIS